MSSHMIFEKVLRVAETTAKILGYLALNKKSGEFFSSDL